ncbi:hypothetical protein GYMLUDRAFT_51213, partial [Collybiopsis luxurians FD-317 M1]
MHQFWTEFDCSTRAFHLGFAESYYWLCNSCSSGSTSESSPTITSHQYINLPNSCITQRMGFSCPQPDPQHKKIEELQL